MNRKQRRAGARQPSSHQAASGAQDMFADAVRHHQAGRLGEAEQRYRQILAVEPRHADSLHLLGLAAFQAGRLDSAVELIGKALNVRPDYPEALSNLGNVLANLGRLDEAVASYRKALGLRLNYPEGHINLGNALRRQGKLEDAAGCYRDAIGFRVNYPEAHVNLGNTLEELGKPEEAIACYRRALQFRPDLPEAHNNLGGALYALGRIDEAVASYLEAVKARPSFAMALNNLASALIAQGKPEAALSVVKRSLQIEETDDAKGIFVSSISALGSTVANVELRPLLVRALTEAWGRPGDLSRAAAGLLTLDRDVAALGADPLLIALLEAAPIGDLEMERFLTAARRALLETGAEEGLGFYSALARQCFINEYVFAVADDENQRASALREQLSVALEADAPVSALRLVTVAAYFPLCALPRADKLLERSWPQEVAALLAQQVREPAEERQLAAAIPRLTSIDDEVSLLVQGQYEENPYPRWIKVPPSRRAESIAAYLRQKFPLAPLVPFNRLAAGNTIDILVAGCGTGQQSIRTAQQFPEAQVLAIDLSRSSLAYALRKSRELGQSSIEYAQADLLKLESLDRHFDVIEAGGVLHHLADPFAGWRTLLSRLRPGGFMLLGFYSEIARRDVVRLRELIAERGYGATADDIRRCRQELMDLDKGSETGSALPSDLFSLSACRDLLFHVQEHRLTLTAIETFLRENKLMFLGFEIAPEILHAYRMCFPEDPAATNLAQWRLFENEHPDTFVGMYQFWVQKVGNGA